MFSFILNPHKIEQQQFTPKVPISRLFLFYCEVHITILTLSAVTYYSSHPPLSYTLSLTLVQSFKLVFLLRSVNWVFICHIRSTAKGERLSFSVRRRNWRWLYHWIAPWILSTCNRMSDSSRRVFERKRSAFYRRNDTHSVYGSKKVDGETEFMHKLFVFWNFGLLMSMSYCFYTCSHWFLVIKNDFLMNSWL